MANSDLEKQACLKTLAAVAHLKGEPTPLEFEAFLSAVSTFQPLPVGVIPERLLAEVNVNTLNEQLALVATPELQQQLYRGAYGIVRTKGINPQEAEMLARMREAFQFSPELAESLAKQPLVTASPTSSLNSSLVGMAALIGREGTVRRLIFDYALGAAIVGLIPLTGGGSLEIKLLVVLGLILKMSWDIRNLWGRPTGQDSLAMIGNMFGFIAAVLVAFLAWATMIGLGVIIPYVGAFAKAAAFATATWIAGQSVNQFYTSQKRPDLPALKRAFPFLMPSETPRSNDYGPG